MNTKLFAVAAAFGLVASAASAQTVTVGPAGDFATISAAMLSFDAGTSGANSGQPNDPNVILVQDFGPFDESFPVTGPVVSGGTGDSVEDGGEPLTIRGDGIRPLLLVQAQSGTPGSNDGIFVNGPNELTLENLIIAPSPTTAVTDDMLRLDSDNDIQESVLNVIDCVITALPAASSGYTAEGDIDADLLDGTRTFDTTSSLVRSGDNGAFVTDGTLNVSGTVWTQQGTGGTPDGMVVSTNGAINVGAGTVLSASDRLGIQMANDSANVTVSGTAANPVVIANHEDSDGIRPFGAGGDLVVDYTIFFANNNGISVFAGAALGTFTVSNSIFAENINIGLDVGDGGLGTSALEVSNTTFYANGIGLKDDVGGGMVRDMNVTDSIFAGTGIGIEIDNAATGAVTVANSAFVTAGPDALTTDVSNSTGVTFTDIVNDDPAFVSTTYTPFTTLTGAPDFYLATTAPSYATASSTSGPLSGGSVYSPTSVGEWSLY